MTYQSLKDNILWEQVWDNVVINNPGFSTELKSHQPYCKDLNNRVKQIVLRVVKELANAEFSKFDEGKTQLKPEVLSKALAFGIGVIGDEAAKSLEVEGRKVKLSAQQQEEWNKLDSRMLEILAEAEKTTDANRQATLSLLYGKLEKQRGGIGKNIDEWIKQEILNGYKQELLKLFKQYYNTEPAQETHAEVSSGRR